MELRIVSDIDPEIPAVFLGRFFRLGRHSLRPEAQELHFPDFNHLLRKEVSHRMVKSSGIPAFHLLPFLPGKLIGPDPVHRLGGEKRSDLLLYSDE